MVSSSWYVAWFEVNRRHTSLWIIKLTMRTGFWLKYWKLQLQLRLWVWWPNADERRIIFIDGTEMLWDLRKTVVMLWNFHDVEKTGPPIINNDSDDDWTVHLMGECSLQNQCLYHYHSSESVAFCVKFSAIKVNFMSWTCLLSVLKDI